MKLICLNLWGGKIYQPLIDFLKKHSTDTDFFCFQETLNTKEISNLKGDIFKDSKVDLYQDLVGLLKDFNGYFAPMLDLKDLGEADFSVPLGQSIFIAKQQDSLIKKDFEIIEVGDIFVYGKEYNTFNRADGFPNSSRNVQYIGLKNNNKEYWIFNYHGVWTPGPKVDNEFRIEASTNIKKLLDSKYGAKILCGDFNLLPETKSLKMLTNGMRDLIKENKIASTRSKHFNKGLSTYSDYMITSIDVDVINFEVLKDEVSDHLPLLLEFN